MKKKKKSQELKKKNEEKEKRQTYPWQWFFDPRLTDLFLFFFFTRLLGQCKRLQFLDVSFCSQLSTEFIRNLQASYPNVDFKKSFVVNEDPL